jgi:hypothetical protein
LNYLPTSPIISQHHGGSMGRDCRYELSSGTGRLAFAEDFSGAPLVWATWGWIWRRGSPQSSSLVISAYTTWIYTFTGARADAQMRFVCQCQSEPLGKRR